MMIRLLIADDEKLEREALADMVSRRFEHEVVLELAENGRKAADTAVLWGADLILMDIEMPGMSGLDAARAVLAQRPACRVIFVTAYSLFQYAHEAVHLGACDYLLKPVDPDELEASIRRAMRQIEAERKLEPTLHFLLLRARVQRLRQIEYHSQFGQVNSFTCRKQRPRATSWRGAFSIRRFRPCGRRIVARWARRHPVRWP